MRGIFRNAKCRKCLIFQAIPTFAKWCQDNQKIGRTFMKKNIKWDQHPQLFFKKFVQCIVLYLQNRNPVLQLLLPYMDTDFQFVRRCLAASLNRMTAESGNFTCSTPFRYSFSIKAICASYSHIRISIVPSAVL